MLCGKEKFKFEKNISKRCKNDQGGFEPQASRSKEMYVNHYTTVTIDLY